MSERVYALVQGQVVPVMKFDYSITLDVANQFSIEVPIADLQNYRNIKNQDVSVYCGEQLIISGFVFERISLKIVDNEVLVGELKCYDDLGRLTCDPSITTLSTQDELLVTTIDTILGSASLAWTRVNVNFTNELTEVSTIDLRGKETLFAQLVELVKSIPQLHIRYGGIDGLGNRVLEVGEFNDITSQFMQGTNLIDLELQPLQDTQYSRIVAIGGIGRDEKINLNLATQDARYAGDALVAQYPVSANASGDFEINDTLSTANCGISKTFNLQKTNNEGAVSDADKIEAGYALWHKAIAFLQSKGDFDTYTGSIITNQIPNIGDRAWLTGQVFERAFNELTFCYDKVPTFSVSDNYRIVKLSTKLDKYKSIDEFGCVVNDDEFIVDFEITNGEEAQDFDDTMQLNEDNNNKFSDTLPTSNVVYQTQSVTNDGIGNCANAPIVAGFTFTFTPTGFTASQTVVTATIASSNPNNIQSVVVQNPTINPTQDLILCVSDVAGDLSTLAIGQEISVTVAFSYS
jgi:hypothetical protein